MQTLSRSWDTAASEGRDGDIRDSNARRSGSFVRRAAKQAFTVTNRLLRRLGWKMVRVDRPTRTFEEFFAHIAEHGFVPCTVIDVGAANGTPSLHLAFPNAHFILIEPLAEFHAELELLSRAHRCDIVHAAAGRSEGMVEIVLHRNPYGTFVRRPRSDEQEGRPTREVTVTTLDAVIARVAPQPPFLLKLDIQGHELEALAGLSDANMAKCEVVIIETGLIIRDDTLPSFHDIVACMAGRGFSVHDILDGLLRPSDQSLGFVDLAFVRDDSKLRRKLPWLGEPLP